MKRKMLAVGIILLFIGSCIIPAMAQGSEKTSLSKGYPPSPPVMWTENFCDFYIYVPQNPEEDQIYYMINWGDGTSSGWIGPFDPDVTITISHGWVIEGTYPITVQAKNQDGVSNTVTYALDLSSDFKSFFVTLGYVSITYICTISYDEALYYLFDWGDGNNSGWLGTGLGYHCWMQLGTYPLKWKFKDINGTETIWSDPLVLTIVDGNQPPMKPDITGPPRIKYGVVSVYSARTTDPDGDCVYYYFDWGDNTTSGWVGPHTSGQTVPITHSWNFKGTYTVKVKAKDVYGAESDWETLPVWIPFSIDIPVLSFFEWLSIHFPNAFPILQFLRIKTI
jgi:hypothetical protein